MSDGVTFCEDCAHCQRVNKSDPPWRWLCRKQPRMEGFGFVSKGAWDDMPPFLFAKDVNGGRCPMFEKVQPGQLKMDVGK